MLKLKTTKRLTVLLLVVLALSAACSKKKPEAVKELVIGIESSPKTLDPRFATDAYGMRISHHLIFSTLVQLGYDLTIVPALAESWETPDNRTYIFHLRKGVSFHNGDPLTAEDVKFTFEHLTDAKTKSPFAGTYKGKIEAIEVIDQTTVKFRLTQPVASFLTSIIMPILPSKVVAADGEGFGTRLIGSGPYKFASQSPTEIILTKNDKYFDSPPKIAKAVIKIVKDDNTRFLKMKNQELDLVINAIPAAKIDEFSQKPLSDHYTLIEAPGIAYNYIGFNLKDPMVKNSALRQAIAHGIDVDEFIRFRLHGHASRATGLLSPANWFCDQSITATPHDPNKAKALLDQAGLSDPDGEGPEMRLSLELKTSNNTETVANARILQAQLAKIGIRLELKSYEWGTFYGDIKAGNFQLTVMRWVGVTEPDFYYDIFHSSQIPPVGRNRGRYVNPKMDELVEKGRITLDPDERKRIYAEVQQIAAKDLPYISLWHVNNISIVHKKIRGYQQHPQAGFFSFKNIWFEEK
jgi:peptide/nickel transport system substrate-binding protein